MILLSTEYYEVKAGNPGIAAVIAHTLKRIVRGFSITTEPRAGLRRTSFLCKFMRRL